MWKSRESAKLQPFLGGDRRFEQHGASDSVTSRRLLGSGCLQLGAAQLWPSTPQESNLCHKFNMTVLTNTISAFIFGFRKGMMALPRNHY